MIAALHALFVSIGGAAFLRRRSIHLLRYLQQEEYNSRRFLGWWRAQRALDRRGAVIVIPIAAAMAAVSASGMTTAAPQLVIGAVGMLLLILRAHREVDPRVAGKKKLVFTQRATRIYRTALALAVPVAALPAITLLIWEPEYGAALAWLWLALSFQLAPVFLACAVMALAPGEKRIQDTLYQEARGILASVGPTIVGITGSYGKTSTKMLLGELLSVDAPAFWTANSINTVMGITREIREKLKPHHKWAVMEMGAYNIGSIQRLCDFTPPQAAIITAVGVMHLERFGSPENVYRAKSELARNVPHTGILVCNGDDPGARRMAREFPKATTLLYGFDGDDLDCRMHNISTSTEGTRFNLRWQGEDYEGSCGLFGKPMLSNLMAALTMAMAFGIHPKVLLATARKLKPVANRLQVERAGEITYIHDAYNSNPAGFNAALDVLAEMPCKRRIVITPGMVELGAVQEQENRMIARRAGAICDLVLLVADTNRAALEAGLAEAGATAKTRWFARRDDAFAALAQLRTAGDAVLIENDLPDLYEGEVIL